MAQFSIKKALRFSFSSYVHHFGLFLVAGLLLGGSAFLLEKSSQYLASQCGVDISLNFDFADSQKDSNSLSGTFEQKGALAKAKEGLRRTIDIVRAKKKSDLGFVCLATFLSWLVQVLLSIGVAKIALTLRDAKQPRLSQLFKGCKVLPRWVGAILLLVSYALGLALLIAVLAILFAFALHALTKNDQLTAIVTIVGCVCCFFAIAYKFFGYTFFGFSLLDIPNQTVRGSLRASQSLVGNSRLKLVGALLVLTMVCVCVAAVLTGLLGGIKSLAQIDGYITKESAQSLTLVFTGPIGTLFLASLYRDLTQPRPVV